MRNALRVADVHRYSPHIRRDLFQSVSRLFSVSSPSISATYVLTITSEVNMHLTQNTLQTQNKKRRDRAGLQWVYLTPQYLGVCLAGGSMQRINVQYFYRLATNLRPLASVAAGKKVDEVFGELYSAEAELRYFLWNAIMPPDASFQAGYELLEAIQELTKEIGKSKEIDFIEASKITDGLNRFEVVLQADFARRDMFAVSKKGIYSTTDLVERAETMFSQGVRDRVPGALGDIHAAGRCIAFELATAAGFHIFRAVEAVGREYVTVVRKSPPTEKEKRLGLGGYKKILEAHGADGRVVNALDQLRKLHRNPTMHPEVTLTTDEVVNTLGMAQSVIQAMVADMEKFKDSPKEEIVQSLPKVEQVAEDQDEKPDESEAAGN
jgi:hypothetical protein